MSDSALAKRDSFEVRVELTPDEIWERLLSNDRVREANEPAPEPSPPRGRPFLVARASADEIRLRHWAGPADASCPVVVVQMRQVGTATLVSGRFESRRRQLPLVEKSLARSRPRGFKRWAGVGGLVLAIAIAAPLLIGVAPIHLLSILALLAFFTVPTVLVFVPAVMIWNGEVRKGFVRPMWELLGEVFTPIALPAEDGREAPFRHAIGGST